LGLFRGQFSGMVPSGHVRVFRGHEIVEPRAPRRVISSSLLPNRKEKGVLNPVTEIKKRTLMRDVRKALLELTELPVQEVWNVAARMNPKPDVLAVLDIANRLRAGQFVPAQELYEAMGCPKTGSRRLPTTLPLVRPERKTV
jgi:hypothetical protein